MTTLDERYIDDDPGFERLVAELDTLGEGSPSPQGDMMIRHALSVHARDLAQQGRTRPTAVGGVPQGRRVPSGWRLLRTRLSVAVAALVAVLLSLGTYLHGQSPTPVSAQTVLHRAATASPGANQATHATYRVTSSDGSTGTANIWIGYDGNAVANQLDLNLTMSQNGRSGAAVNANLVAAGSGLAQVYNTSPGSAGQVPAPSTSGSGSMGVERPVPATPGLGASPTVLSSAADAPARTMKGIVVGTLLAQKLSKQPNAYTLRQETLNGVPVYALQPDGAGNVTYYFNAQSYRLEGADWTQDGKSWQARLSSYSTVPLSAVPTGTFGSGTNAGRPGDKGLVREDIHGSVHTTQQR